MNKASDSLRMKLLYTRSRISKVKLRLTVVSILLFLKSVKYLTKGALIKKFPPKCLLSVQHALKLISLLSWCRHRAVTVVNVSYNHLILIYKTFAMVVAATLNEMQ